MTVITDADLLEDGMALSAGELEYLGDVLGAGDRGGFYSTYYAMSHNLATGTQSGAVEAGLQTKIATFSDDVGAIAFLSNALLQASLGTTTYKGIYYLSQKVADSAFNGMQLPDSIEDGRVGGFLTEDAFFKTAEGAWLNANELEHFPGNVLSLAGIGETVVAIKDFVLWFGNRAVNGQAPGVSDMLDFIAADGGIHAGIRAAALASLYVGSYVGELGKQISDYEGKQGYQIVHSADGLLEYAVNTATGKTVAAGDVGVGESQNPWEVALEAGASIAAAGLGLVSLPLMHAALGTLIDQYAPPDGDWTKLTESTSFGTYDGDANAQSQENDFSGADPHGSIRAAATSGNDILFGTDSFFTIGGNDTIDSDAGNDAIFGAGGEDHLSGGDGADILYGQDGADILIGGAGDDIIRGGTGNDTLYAGLIGSPETGGQYDALDIGSDIVVGGAGDDKVVATEGEDILIGNTGNDVFYLSSPNYDGEEDIPTRQILWGGEGSDEFHFERGDIAFIYTDNATTELVQNIDVGKLFAQLYYDTGSAFDYIVINPEASDKYYYYDEQVVDYTVRSDTSTRTDAHAIGDKFWGDFYNGVAVHSPDKWIESEYTETLKELVSGDWTATTGTFLGSDLYWNGTDPHTIISSDSYYNYVSIGINHFENYPLSFFGYTNGDIGFDLAGNGASIEWSDDMKTYAIVDYVISHYILFEGDGSNTYYYGSIEYPPTLGGLLDEIVSSGVGDALKAPEFDSAAHITIDLNAFQTEPSGNVQAPPELPPHPIGPTIHDDAINGTAVADTIDALAGDDVVLAGDGADIVNGNNGADFIFGQAGNDALAGGAGADMLFGGDGADQLSGGIGADRVEGQGGGDAYSWSVGDGNDTVVDTGDAGDTDILQFLAGVAESDIELLRSDNDLILTVAGIGQITIEGQFSGDGIESISFDGGPTWARAYFEGLAEPMEQPWAAHDDRFWAGFETSTVVDLTANDTIPGGANYNAYLYEQPSHGSVVWNGTGYTYTPDAGFTGVDWFYYGLFDADNNDENMTPDNPGVAIVHVGQTVDPNDYTGVTGSVGTGNSTYFGGSSFDDTALFTGGNTSFADGKGGDDTMVFSGDVADYRIQGNDDHFWVYNSANAAADVIEITNFEHLKFADTGKLAISDIITAAGHEPGDIWPDSRPINVPHANGSAWVANDDRYWTTAGTAVVLNMTGNDTIPTGAHYNAAVWDQPQHGTIAFNGTDYVYTPDTGFTGADWFTYALTDPDNNDEAKTEVPGFGVIHVGQAYDPGNNQGVSASVGAGGSFGGSRFNDTVNYSAGDGPFIDGKAGDDIIVFNGDIQDYRIQGNGNSFWIYNDSNPSQSATIEFTNVEYIQFNGTAALSLSDIIAAANHSPGDFWFDSEPIGGLV
ncbi:Ig-like domain-containing protein [Mesorhizobium sp. M7D.F.Ca.US.005.01.1.1]|uniref:Ig-like domain-containing protein n=1 Tax=Mesorhizobium sp. M7D.F.Ca.US.005.01.1.1 TaxID=2493678 RepID=UPI0013DF91E2|nr:Ig-like domain-containing protein [Mesorhizobium sp. M7D.F.Ca.US.005.01.1.1]